MWKTLLRTDRMRGPASAALAAALWFATVLPAAAQQLPEAYDLHVTGQDLAVIEQGLLELPLKTSGAPYSRVIEMVRKQQMPAPKPADPPAEEKK